MNHYWRGIGTGFLLGATAALFLRGSWPSAALLAVLTALSAYFDLRAIRRVSP